MFTRYSSVPAFRVEISAITCPLKPAWVTASKV